MQINRLMADAQKFHQQGNLTEAKKRYDQILAQNPGHGMARLFRAVILQQTGQVLSAVDEARQAMQDTPDADAMMWVNYGIVLKNANLLDEAQKAYEKSLQLNPKLNSVKANLSTLYLITGRLKEAQQLCLQLTEILEDAGTWLNLARIALVAGETERAAECLQNAEDIAPKHPDIPYLKAQRYAQDKDDENCFKAVMQALKIRPSHMEAWLLIKVLDPVALDLDDLEEAAHQLAKSEVQQVNQLAEAVNLCRRHLLWAPLESLETLLSKALENPIQQAASVSAVFTLLSANIPQRAHLQAARAAWRQLTLGIIPTPVENHLIQRIPGRKIKVAFLSSDLRNHAVAYNMVGFFEALPHDDIEWFAYSNSFDDDSEMRKRIRKSMDRFINIAQLTDEEVAEKIRSDTVDILIDLNNMTRGTRVRVMAYRPAPVQITTVGAPGSLGADEAIDYIIPTPLAIDNDNVDGFSEFIIEANIVAHDPVKPDFELAGTRADHELPENAVVLCCFNQHQKISPDTFRMWCEILRTVENTVLWLVKPSDQALSRLYEFVEAEGIATERLILAPQISWEKHIARIRHADLILDTLPYGAHTTCADGLTPILLQ